MRKLPLAKNKDIVVQPCGKEILIYNLITHKAYNLNETSSVVFNACDGVNSFDELKTKHQLTDDLIWLALDGLKKEGLLEDREYASPFAGMNRREVIRRIGLASMIALPVVSSLIAPTAAMAQSKVCAGGFPPDANRGNCTAGVGQPPATQEGCTSACQTVYGSSCLSCMTKAVEAMGNPGVFACRCA